MITTACCFRSGYSFFIKYAYKNRRRYTRLFFCSNYRNDI